MPPLDNPTYEDFARYLSNGMSASQAVKKIGEFNQQYGAQLLKKPEVIARIAELVEEREAKREKAEMEYLKERAAAAGHNIPALATEVNLPIEAFTVEFILNQLLDVAVQAKKANQFSVANKAFQTIADALGVFESARISEKDKKELKKEDSERNLITLDSLTKAFSKNGVDLKELVSKKK